VKPGIQTFLDEAGDAAKNHGGPVAENPWRKEEKHGRWGSKEYFVWAHIIQRCCNSKDASYPRYGGRGIAICNEWRESFSAFHRDMGDAPGAEFQLDRINNDGNYEPGNCRWVTCAVNNRNRPSTKLNPSKVCEIRALHAAGTAKKAIARRFQVTPTTIRGIIRGAIWREVV
jgi:hypothetical protein